MKTIQAIAVVFTLLLVACGGDEFAEGYWAGPDTGAGDAGPEATSDATGDATGEASEDTGTDAAKPEAAVDAPPDSPADSAPPDAAPEAGPDAELDAELDAPTTDSPADSPMETTVDAEPDVCVPSTCAQLGKNCGPVSDGCGGSLDCGSCDPSESCGGGGVPNVCGGCVPLECNDIPQYCGLLEDGCGNTLDCGPYKRGYDPSCQSSSHPYKWYCDPEQVWAPPPFETGCVPASWPGSYCCSQGD